MPELPEVETLVRELKSRLKNKKIEKVKILAPKILAPLSRSVFIKKIKGLTIQGVTRRAKVIIISLSNNYFLLIHLKMTGQLIFVSSQGQSISGGHPYPPDSAGNEIKQSNKYTRAEFHFTDKSVLYFNDLRKFGWLKLVAEKDKNILLANHGIEPLVKKFTPAIFIEIITKYPNRKIKQSLLDQSLIAGLGNIYADEACFLAKIKPDRLVYTLTPTELRKLHQAIISVLKLSIKMKGTSAKNYVRADGSKGGFVPYLNVYGRNKQPCKKCGQAIVKIKLIGRGTHFCQKCQH